MEGLLTALVNRALSRFIKRAGNADNLRVNVQRGGGLLLSNLELNLDPLMAKLPGLTVSRAFAMRLQVVIPWTNLFGSPIQIVLDTVEVVLDVHEEALARWVPPPPPPTDASVGDEASSSWGSWVLGWSSYLQTQLRRIVGNVEVSLRNVVVKLRTLRHVATLTCQSVDLNSGQAGVPSADPDEDWLAKALEVTGLSLSISDGSPWAASGVRIARVPKLTLRMSLPWPPGILGIAEPSAAAPSAPSARPASLWLEVQPVEVASAMAHLADLLTVLQTVAAVRKSAQQLVQEGPRMTHHESMPRLPPYGQAPGHGRKGSDFTTDGGVGYDPASEEQMAFATGDPESGGTGQVALDMFGTPVKQPPPPPRRASSFLESVTARTAFHPRTQGLAGTSATFSASQDSSLSGSMQPPLITKLEASVRIQGVTLALLAPSTPSVAPPPSAQSTPTASLGMGDLPGGSVLRELAEITGQYHHQRKPSGSFSIPVPPQGSALPPGVLPPPPTHAQQPQQPQQELASVEVGTLDFRANIVLGTGYGASLSLHYLRLALQPEASSPEPSPTSSYAFAAPQPAPSDELFALRPGEGMQWAVHSTFQGPLGSPGDPQQPGTGISLNCHVGELHFCGCPDSLTRLKQLQGALSTSALHPPSTQPTAQGRTGASLFAEPLRHSAPSPDPLSQQFLLQQQQQQAYPYHHPSISMGGAGGAGPPPPAALPPRAPRVAASPSMGLSNNPPQPQLQHSSSFAYGGTQSTWQGGYASTDQHVHSTAAFLPNDPRPGPSNEGPLSQPQALDLQFSLQRLRAVYFAASGPAPCASVALGLEHVNASFGGHVAHSKAPDASPPSHVDEDPGRFGQAPYGEAGEPSFSGRVAVRGGSASAGHSRNPSWGSSLTPVHVAPLAIPETPSHAALTALHAPSPTGTVVVHSRAVSWSSQLGSPFSHHTAPPQHALGTPAAPYLPPAPPPERPGKGSSFPFEIAGVWSLQGASLSAYMGASAVRLPTPDPRIPSMPSHLPSTVLRDCGFAPILFSDTPQGEVPGAGLHLQGHLGKGDPSHVSASTFPLRLTLASDHLRALGALVPSLHRHLRGPQGLQHCHVQLTGAPNPNLLWNSDAGLEVAPVTLQVAAFFGLGPQQQPLCTAELTVTDLAASQPESRGNPSARDLQVSFASLDLSLQQSRVLSVQGVRLHQSRMPRRRGSLPLLPAPALDPSPPDLSSLTVQTVRVDLSAPAQAALVHLLASLPPAPPSSDHPRPSSTPPPTTAQSVGGVPLLSTPPPFAGEKASGGLPPTGPSTTGARNPNSSFTGAMDSRRGSTIAPSVPQEPRSTFKLEVADLSLSATLWDSQYSLRDLPCLYAQGRRLDLTDLESRSLQLQAGQLRCTLHSRPAAKNPAAAAAIAAAGGTSREPQTAVSVESLSLVSRRALKDGRIFTMPLLQTLAPSSAPSNDRAPTPILPSDIEADLHPPFLLTVYPPTLTHRQLIDLSLAPLRLKLDSDLLNLAKWTLFQHQRASRALRGLPEYGEDLGPQRIQGIEALAAQRLAARTPSGQWTASLAGPSGSEFALQTSSLSLDLMTSLNPDEPEWYRTEFTLSAATVRVAPQSSLNAVVAAAAAAGGLTSGGAVGPQDDRVRSVLGLSPKEAVLDLTAFTVTGWGRSLPPSGHIVLPPTNATASMLFGGNPQTSLMSLKLSAVQASLSMDSIFAFYRPMVSAIKISTAPDPASPLPSTILQDDLQAGIWLERVPRGPLTEPLGPMQMTLSSRWIGPGSSLPESDPPPPPKFSRWILWRYAYARTVRKVWLASGGSPGEVTLLTYRGATWETVALGTAGPDGALSLESSGPSCDGEIWALCWTGTEHPETFLARLMVNPGSGLEGPEVPSFPAPQRLSSIFTMVLESAFAMLRWCDHPPSALEPGAVPSTRELAVLDLAPCTLRLDVPPETNACIALRAASAKLYCIDAFSRAPAEVLDAPGLQFGFEYSTGEFRGAFVHAQEVPPSAASVRQHAWLPSEASPLWNDVRLPRPNPFLGGKAVLIRGLEDAAFSLRLTRGLLETAKVALEDIEAAAAFKKAAAQGPSSPWVDERAVPSPPSSHLAPRMGPVCPARVVRVRNELPFDVWVTVPVSAPHHLLPASSSSSTTPLRSKLGAAKKALATREGSLGRWAPSKGLAVIPGPAVGAAGGLVTVSSAGAVSEALEIRARSPGKKLLHLQCGPGLFTPVAVSVSYSASHPEGVGGAWTVTLCPGFLVKNQSSIPVQVRCAAPDTQATSLLRAPSEAGSGPGAVLAPVKPQDIVYEVQTGATVRITPLGSASSRLSSSRSGSDASGSSAGVLSPPGTKLSETAASPTYSLCLGENSHFLPWFEIGPDTLAELKRSSNGSLTILGGQAAHPAAVCAMLSTDKARGTLTLTLRDPLVLSNPLSCPLMVEYLDRPPVQSSSIVVNALHPPSQAPPSRFPSVYVLEPGQTAASGLAPGRRIRFRCGTKGGGAAAAVVGGAETAAAVQWGPWSEPVEAPRLAPTPALDYPASLPTRRSLSGEVHHVLPPQGPTLLFPGGDAVEVAMGLPGAKGSFPAIALAMLEGGVGPVKLALHPRTAVRNDSAVTVDIVSKASGATLCSLAPASDTTTESSSAQGPASPPAPRSVPLPWNADDEPMYSPILVQARITNPGSQWDGITWVSESVTLTAEPSVMELRLTATSLPSAVSAAAPPSLRSNPPTLKLVLRLATSRPVAGVSGPKFVQLSILPAVTVLNESSLKFTVVHRFCSATVAPGELHELSLLGGSSVIQLQTEAGDITDPVDLSTLGTAGVAVLPVLQKGTAAASSEFRVIARWLGLAVRRDQCQLQITLIEPDVAPVVLRNRLQDTLWAAVPQPPAPSSSSIPGPLASSSSLPILGPGGVEAGDGNALLFAPSHSREPSGDARDRPLASTSTCWVAVPPGESRPFYIPEQQRPLFGIGGLKGSGQIPGSSEDGAYLLDQVSYSPAKRPSSNAAASVGSSASLRAPRVSGASNTSHLGPTLVLRKSPIDSGSAASAPSPQQQFEASVPLIPGTDFSCEGIFASLETSGPTVIATVRDRAPSSPAPGALGAPHRLDVSLHLPALTVGLWESAPLPAENDLEPDLPSRGAHEFAAFELAGLDLSFEQRTLPSLDSLAGAASTPVPASGFEGTHSQSAVRLGIRDLGLIVFGPIPRATGRLVARISKDARGTRRQFEQAVALELVQRTLAVGSGWSVASYPLVRLTLSPVQVQLDDDVLEDLVATGTEWALLAGEYGRKKASTGLGGCDEGEDGDGTEGRSLSRPASGVQLPVPLQSHRRYVWLGDVHLGEVRAILDLNLSHVGPQALPLVLDTRQSPLVLAPVRIGGALFDLQAAREGLVAHYTAEALLNAPQLLGSVSWLFNVTGLVQSLRSGLRDMVVNPLAQLTSEEGSTTAFLAEVGGGTASLLRHLSSWSLTSLAGFSSSMARTLETLTDFNAQGQGDRKGGGRGRPSGGAPPRPSMFGSVRRSILQAVTLPLSGALDLLGTASAVLAASAGLDNAEPGRAGLVEANDAHDLIRVPRPVCDGHLFSIPACLMGVNGHVSSLEGPSTLSAALSFVDQIGALVVISLQGETGRLISVNEGIISPSQEVRPGDASSRTLLAFHLTDVFLEENGVFVILLPEEVPRGASEREGRGTDNDRGDSGGAFGAEQLQQVPLQQGSVVGAAAAVAAPRLPHAPTASLGHVSGSGRVALSITPRDAALIEPLLANVNGR